MVEELARIRERILARLRDWDKQGVPLWKYALLVARPLEALAGGTDPPALAIRDEAKALIRWVITFAERQAAGRDLSSAERQQAAFVGGQLLGEPPYNSPYSGPATPPFVDWLWYALHYPSDAAQRMAEFLEWSGLT
jgi:hypothetical protein